MGNFQRAADMGVAWQESAPNSTPGPADYSMVEVFCRCSAAVGTVGVPSKRGASVIEVAFRCADCGHTTHWRSVER